MPVGMRHTPAMPVAVDVAREQGRIAAQRRIERIAGRIRSMVMVVGVPDVNVIMLDELRLKNVRLATMFDRDDDVEFVRLGNLLDGFPVSPVICEEKDLALPAGAQCLDPDGVSGDAGRTEPRRNA